MNNRRLVQLKEIAETQTGPFGSQLHEEDYVSVGTPIVTVEHLGETGFIPKNLPLVSDEDKERLSKYSLDEGDIVFSRVGSIDRCTYVTKNEAGWLFSGRCLRVRINKNANARFVSFYFRQRYFKEMMLNISVGATMPSLNTSLMDNIPIYLPELEEQNKIASLLDSLDSKITLNNRINAELEAMAKTVYDYWFVQFDFPNSEGKPYKSSGGKMVWSEELKREIPEGWEVSLIADWILKDKNGDWGKESIEGNYTEHVSCIRGADINGLNGKGECNPPERYILEKNSTKQLNSHDLIVEISGGSPTQSTGRLAYLIDETLNRFDNPLICSNFCKAIELKNKKQLFNFVYNWNRLYDNGILFGYEGKTSGIKNLLFESFVNSYWVVVPNKEVVDKFYDLMLDIERKKQTALKENQQLSSLRDWLLPMLMNGQVKVGEVAEEVETLIAAEPGVEYISARKDNSTTSFKQWTIGERTILAAYLIKKFNGKGFGRVMLMKLLFLIEYICELDFDSQYKVNVAGPYDDLIREIELKLRTHKLYNAKQDKFDNHVTYQEMGGTTNVESLFCENFSQEVSLINSILEKFKNSHWEQCEIIATMYAVWNNRLIKCSPINDMALKQDFLNWDPHKAIYKDRLDSALTWMRSHDVVPKGWGKAIEK